MFALLVLAAGLADPPATKPGTKDGKHGKLTATLTADVNKHKTRFDVELADGWKVEKASYELWLGEPGGGWQRANSLPFPGDHFIAGKPTAAGRKTVSAFVESSARPGWQVQVRNVKLHLHNPTAVPKGEEVIEIEDLDPVTVRAARP